MLAPAPLTKQYHLSAMMDGQDQDSSDAALSLVNMLKKVEGEGRRNQAPDPKSGEGGNERLQQPIETTSSLQSPKKNKKTTKASTSTKKSIDAASNGGDEEGLKGSTYRDYSHLAASSPQDQVAVAMSAPPAAIEDEKNKTGAAHHPAKEPTFPVKLHMILSNPDFADVIAWLPHGRSWRILQQKEFEQRVIPLYFRHGRYASFARQVNGWGFKRITSGSDYNSYYHQLFLRGLPHLAEKMKRLTTKDIAKRKEVADEENPPDFYQVSRDHPLPEKPVGGFPTVAAINQNPPAFSPRIRGNMIGSGGVASGPSELELAAAAQERRAQMMAATAGGGSNIMLDRMLALQGTGLGGFGSIGNSALLGGALHPTLSSDPYTQFLQHQLLLRQSSLLGPSRAALLGGSSNMELFHGLGLQGASTAVPKSDTDTAALLRQRYLNLLGVEVPSQNLPEARGTTSEDVKEEAKDEQSSDTKGKHS